MANLLPHNSPVRSVRPALFLLCAATLAFEINLTRLFSVAQFYHFAFMIVSLALLGFGASGSFLAIFPKFGVNRSKELLSWLAFACGLGILGAYLLTNWLPFDSFSIAWEPKQTAVLALHYLALATPFFFSGLATGMLLNVFPTRAASTYAANLLGSAAGCALALLAPPLFGAEGLVTLSAGLACTASLLPLLDRPSAQSSRLPIHLLVAAFALLILTMIDTGQRLMASPTLSWLELQISPYKSLSYALQYPDAQVISRRWNAYARVDVVRSTGIRSLPGLSYRYLESPPPEDGLLIDADELNAIILPGYGKDLFDYLPGAIAYRLHPDARVLILEPRGGLDILTALALDAQQVTAVEPNDLVIAAASHIYAQPNVSTIRETGRSYTRRASAPFDIVVISLANAYHPVRSGAYSLAEDYRYTLEAFERAFVQLTPDGVLLVTRWLQNPPSESLRLFGLAVETVSAGDPREQIVALRGYNTVTVLVKRSPFLAQELADIKSWTAERAFDMVYAPGMHPSEANRYNVMPEPVYYQSFQDLLAASPREEFYAAYPFEIRPPTDDHPFFGHYFKWSQAPQALAELGKTWQPFGGAGYFVMLALLVLASFMAGLVVILPVAVARWRTRKAPGKSASMRVNQQPTFPAWRYLVYFVLIGLGFLLVEIPLFQRFILFLGQPAYALTAVLFALLFFSGIGSALSEYLPLRVTLALLVFLLAITPSGLAWVFDRALGLPLAGRLALTTALLAPLGFLMGVAFPGGIRWVIRAPGGASWVPWAWALNGAASVVASVLAAMLALSFGFTWVFWLGAVCYAGAWISVIRYRSDWIPSPVKGTKRTPPIL